MRFVCRIYAHQTTGENRTEHNAQRNIDGRDYLTRSEDEINQKGCLNDMIDNRKRTVGRRRHLSREPTCQSRDDIRSSELTKFAMEIKI